MSSSVFERCGDAIARHSELTLAAYLGDSRAIAAAHSAAIPFPTAADFRAERAFDPNPHGLPLEEDEAATMFLVRTLAFFGPRPLVDLAVSCAATAAEVAAEGAAPPLSPPKKRAARIVAARERAFAAARAFQTDPAPARAAAAEAAAAECRALYAPFEDDPDAPEAEATWQALGASWFAAETAAQDFALQAWDGPGPIAASTTWGARNSVWPQRAADAAARVVAHPVVRERLTRDLIALAVRRSGGF
jgi:hypothetical protein